MLIEPDILGGHRRLDHVWGDFIIVDKNSVFQVEGRQHFAVLGYDLGGKVHVWSFNIVHRRHVSKKYDAQDRKDHCQYR